MTMTKGDFADYLRNRVFNCCETYESESLLWSEVTRMVPPTREEGFNVIEWQAKLSASGQRDGSGDIAWMDSVPVLPFKIGCTTGLTGIKLGRDMWDDLINAADNKMLKSGTINEVVSQVAAVEARLPESLEIDFLGDGTGRKAKVSSTGGSVNDTTKWIILRPVFTQCCTSDTDAYAIDAIKLLRVGDHIDIGAITGAFHCTDAVICDIDMNRYGVGYRIRVRLSTDKPWSRTAGFAGDSLASVVAGDFIFLHDNRAAIVDNGTNQLYITGQTGASGDADVMPEILGLEAIIGDGYQISNSYEPQGTIKLYGQLATAASIHKSYVTRGTTMTNTQTWSDKVMHDFEEGWKANGGFYGDDARNGKQPITVNGKPRFRVEIWGSPNTIGYIRQLSDSSTSTGGSRTIFREINAGDQAKVGYGGADVIYKSRYFGDIPMKSYWRIPEGKLFWIRPDQLFTWHKGPSIMDWRHQEGSNALWQTGLYAGLGDVMMAVLRTTGQIHCQARARMGAMINIALS